MLIVAMKGIRMNKKSYYLILWSLILVLVGSCLWLYGRQAQPMSNVSVQEVTSVLHNKTIPETIRVDTLAEQTYQERRKHNNNDDAKRYQEQPKSNVHGFHYLTSWMLATCLATLPLLFLTGKKRLQNP